MKKESLEVIYKAIQILEAIILIILGIVVCAFANNENLQNAINYCLAFILIIFGLFTIAFSYLFSKGVISLDSVFGALLVSLGILLICKEDVVSLYLPLFFGIMLITYGSIFFVETIVLVINIRKDSSLALKLVVFILTTLVLIGGGITIVLIHENATELILVLVGVLLILLGILSLCHFISKAKKKDGTSLINTNKQISHVNKSNDKSSKQNETTTVDVKEINYKK